MRSLRTCGYQGQERTPHTQPHQDNPQPSKAAKERCENPFTYFKATWPCQSRQTRDAHNAAGTRAFARAAWRVASVTKRSTSEPQTHASVQQGQLPSFSPQIKRTSLDAALRPSLACEVRYTYTTREKHARACVVCARNRNHKPPAAKQPNGEAT